MGKTDLRDFRPDSDDQANSRYFPLPSYADQSDPTAEMSSHVRIRINKSVAFPERIFQYVMLFSTRADRSSISQTCKAARDAYKTYYDSVNHFDLASLGDELRSIGGWQHASKEWCDHVLKAVAEAPVGNIKSVDLSTMRAKVIEKLFDRANLDQSHVFKDVTHFVLPTGIVDWNCIHRLAQVCPQIREVVISSLNAEYLYKTEPRFGKCKTIDDVLNQFGVNASKFDNLRAYEEQMRKDLRDARSLTFLVIALKKHFGSLEKLRINHSRQSTDAVAVAAVDGPQEDILMDNVWQENL